MPAGGKPYTMTGRMSGRAAPKPKRAGSMSLGKISQRTQGRQARMAAINTAKGKTAAGAAPKTPPMLPKSSGGNATRKMGSVLRNMSNGKKLAIGAGALAIGGAAIGNRRQGGTSSGRQSMYNF